MLFVFLPAIKIYNKDKGDFKWPKALNLIISFLLFLLFTNNLRNEIAIVLLNSSKIYSLYYRPLGLIGPNLNFSLWISYLLLSLILAGIVISLAFRNERGRKLFLRIIPFMWILDSVHFYSYFDYSYLDVKMFDIEPTSLLFYIFLFYGAITFIVFRIYASQPFKHFFKRFQSN